MGAPTALDVADDALLRHGRLRTAREAYEQAYLDAERLGDPAGAARAALGLGGLWVHELRGACDAAAVEARQRAALARVGPSSPLGLRLRVRLAAEEDYRAGATDGVLAALAEARNAGDPIALAEALSLAHHCLLGPDHVDQRDRLAQELLRVAAGTGRAIDALMGLLWNSVDRYLAGDPLADRTLAELRQRLAEQDHAAVGFVARALEVMLAIRAGRLDDAESLAMACARAGELAGDVDAAGWYAGQLTVIRWYQGRSAELVPHLTALAGATGTGAVDVASFAALAVGYASAGDHTQAACALARVRGEDFRDVVRSSSWLVAMYAAVETAYLVGDAETATLAYQVLRPFADLPVMLSLGVACLGSAHHPLGVAALTCGDAVRAVEHFQRAVQANRALGHLLATRLSQERLAEALRVRAGATPGPATAVELARRGPRDWSVRVGDRSVVVPDATGMRYLAVLAERPGDEVAPLDLVHAVQHGSAVAAAAHTGSTQPLLDGRALREYRARLAALDGELAEAGDDLARAHTASAEREWLLAEIAAATGLDGRTRTFTDDAERARIAVTKAIRRSVDRVAQADPSVGAALAARVRTGARCCLAAA